MVTVSKMINELSSLIGSGSINEVEQSFIKEIAFKTNDGMQLDTLNKSETKKVKELWGNNSQLNKTKLKVK